jgi:tripartite-type tricarboxylate transporter receptor subunit TctC
MTLPVRASGFVSALVLLALAGAFAVTQAADSQYPSRPVRMVVPFAPGGGSDILARTLAPKLSASTGQSWVVDNRSGAAGNIGAEIVVRANPDGYTILKALNTQLTVNPSLYKLSFDVQKDLQPVTMLATADHVLVVHPSVQAKTFKEFLALAKQKPGALNYASSGGGSAIHMAAELLKHRTGIDLTHIPYKGGGPAALAVIAGEAQLMTGTAASVLPFLTTGRLRALATTGPRRSRVVVPEVPTVAESGYPGFDTSQWYGILVPAATPRSITDRIRSEMLKVLQQPDVRAALVSQGVELETTTPEELAARIKSETAAYAAVIKAAGIRAE